MASKSRSGQTVRNFHIMNRSFPTIVAPISSLTSTGDVALVRISPDGRYLAYISLTSGCCSQVVVCARFPPKMHDGNRDSAVPDLLCDVSKQRVARLMQRATQMQQLGGVSILLLFQVP